MPMQKDIHSVHGSQMKVYNLKEIFMFIKVTVFFKSIHN